MQGKGEGRERENTSAYQIKSTKKKRSKAHKVIKLKHNFDTIMGDVVCMLCVLCVLCCVCVCVSCVVYVCCVCVFY